jgi:hypothetical protein
MSFEIGPIPSQRPAPGVTPSRPSAPVSGPSFQATLKAVSAPRPLAPVDTVQFGIPPTLPPAVLDEIGAAAERVDALAASNRELHFHQDEETGRVVVQVRDLATGAVIRTIPPSGALAAISGTLEV